MRPPPFTPAAITSLTPLQVYSRRPYNVGRMGSLMSDADIVSVFTRKMGAVERLAQRSNADVHATSSGDMKELHARIADVASQIKRERYIEQLEAIENSTRNPHRVCARACVCVRGVVGNRCTMWQQARWHRL